MDIDIRPPKKAITKVLYGLITQPEIKEQNYRLNSFRSILSDLRNDYGLTIRHKDKEGKTKFDRKITYRVHYLWQKDVMKAVRLYNRINKQA